MWDVSDKGRYTFKFLPRVSVSHLYGNYLINLFITNRGPFPAFLHYINKLDSPNCICSEVGDSLHYALGCPVTSEFHFNRPEAALESQWLSNLLNSSLNKSKICKLVSWLLANEISIQPTSFVFVFNCLTFCCF